MVYGDCRYFGGFTTIYVTWPLASSADTMLTRK